MIRKTIFWIHLGCGVIAGLVILMMSVTGVLLTYERQLLDLADRATRAEPPTGAVPLGIDRLLAAVRIHDPAFEATSISVGADPRAPATVSAGRRGSYDVDRYSGTVLPDSAPRLEAFFGAMTGWHRWFNADGDSRTVARAITGASNLAFLFLILSGLYLWLPRVYRWAAFKTRLWFNPKATTPKARDFNWHHVFGIWSAIPLVVVVATAVVFSYGWANDLVYRSFGEEPPQRGPGGGSGEGGRGSGPRAAAIGTGYASAGAAPLSLDALLTRAMNSGHAWRTITLTLPAADAATIEFRLDQGNGGQPQRRHDLVLDARSGNVVAWRPFSSQSAGQQARSHIRFLHTGESLGIVGQTIAGLVSLTSILMVWTGLALAYRRLIAPLFRGRKPPTY
jgi:uncharacterized iron-regulated membrane protein